MFIWLAIVAWFHNVVLSVFLTGLLIVELVCKVVLRREIKTSSIICVNIHLCDIS